MAIYMNYDGIPGTVQTQGYTGWIEVESFTFGTNRPISAPTGAGSDRELGLPSVGDVLISKPLDKSTIQLFSESVSSDENKTVKFAFVTTSKGQAATYLTYELTNTAVASYNISAGGEGKPVESLSLNFTKIKETFTDLSAGGSGTPMSVTYDLAATTTT